MAKVTLERVRDYQRRMEAGDTMAQIAAMDGFHPDTIRRALRRFGIKARLVTRPMLPMAAGRPAWSVPSRELIEIAREGRAEIDHALRQREDGM